MCRWAAIALSWPTRDVAHHHAAPIPIPHVVQAVCLESSRCVPVSWHDFRLPFDFSWVGLCEFALDISRTSLAAAVCPVKGASPHTMWRGLARASLLLQTSRMPVTLTGTVCPLVRTALSFVPSWSFLSVASKTRYCSSRTCPYTTDRLHGVWDTLSL